MGMAASQARFLGLTARKTNVEFEGQQVNQQRTTLSNQSANYYNDLLGMTVPTPPSVDNYTKTVYTFEDGALSNTITSLIASPNGEYTVSYLRKWTDDFSVVAASTSIVTENGDGTYNVGANKLRDLGVAIPDNADNFEHDATGNRTKYIGEYEYLQSMTPEQIDSLIKEEQQYLALLNEKYGTTNSDWLVRYVEDTTTGKQVPYFYKKDDVTGAVYDDNGNSKSNIKCYTVGSTTQTEEVKAVTNCKVEKDSSGRFINITLPELDDDGNPVLDDKGNIVYGPTYSLTTSTVTDQDAYNDAMNQYGNEKYEYDQAINEINAKIEIIQAQDKNLELRLKQLDTEQDAIQTEMDAVQKVIEKNTESSFKTFG